MAVFTQSTGHRSPDFIYHYTSSAGLAGILDSGTFRLSPLSKLNDPRESKELNFGAVSATGRDIPPQYCTREYQQGLSAQANSTLREGVQVLSATVDASTAGQGGFWGHGFAHARNWAQYGDSHRGAVVVLDRDVLVNAVAALPGVSLVLHGPVSYIDRSIGEIPGLGFTADDLDRYPVIEIVERWRNTYSDHFYFEKVLDWSSEEEYRIVAFSPDEVFIPISAALRGIVLGEYFPVTEARQLATRLRRIGIARLGIMRMDWAAGGPGAMELEQDSDMYPGLYRSEFSEQVIPLFDDEQPPSPESLMRLCPSCAVPLERIDADWMICNECGTQRGVPV